jgi:putative copper resistance protein D
VIGLLAAARATQFAGLMAIFGAGAFAWLLRKNAIPEPPGRAPLILFATCATLAIASAILWFGLVVGQMSGDWGASLDPSVLTLAATSTRFGQIFLLRLIGLLALWLMSVTRPRGVGVPLVAAMLLALLAPVSHAAADGGIAGILSDAAHLLAASFWLGGLVILLMLLPLHRANPTALLPPLRVFSIWAASAVALLVATGVINALSILPLSMLSLQDVYIDLLLLKVGIALFMVALAALNRWHLAPALQSRGSTAVRQLQFSICTEIALGMSIIAIVGYLGVTSPH